MELRLQYKPDGALITCMATIPRADVKVPVTDGEGPVVIFEKVPSPVPMTELEVIKFNELLAALEDRNARINRYVRGEASAADIWILNNADGFKTEEGEPA